MITDQNRKRMLLLLSVAGIGLSILSGLEGRVEWLDALCGFLGGGCRETLKYSLLGIEVWIWGLAFYGILAVVVLAFEPAVFWLAMAGFGAEISLAWIMVSRQLISAPSVWPTPPWWF